MPNEDEVVEASQEGRAAARDGLDRSDCTYPPGTVLGNAWRRAYDAEIQKPSR